MRCAVSLLLLLSLLSLSHGYREPGEEADWCDYEQCKLPDCRCSDTDIPGGLPVHQIPQIVMVSFDDAVQDRWKADVGNVLSDHKNPNGCPLGATFFASHEYTSYQTVEEYYSKGYEIASHSISHTPYQDWWKNANETQWHDEIIGMQTIIHEFANIPTDDIQGMRAPLLQTAGDTTYKMMTNNNLKYDSTMPTRRFTDPPLWPYTLDYKESKDCQIEPCPVESWPGAWINVAGLTLFMKEIVDKDDVWIINVGQAIEWIQKPTKLSSIFNFAPWSCEAKPPARCTQAQAKWCRYVLDDGQERYMQTCNEKCPPNYPWVGNPKGE
ncbi:PREDICTED: uncharacterized protein LOC106812465 [Priapulus caudatus]|uniref:Uncharacterized protein LOC106812465 n=1 Tax=Priapulus caudatus TaxID=37621 RepID=A0ABM1EI14_PRICU|nr:PREDICTED: uncharacterized protein LOC106812465 [Priapulus caudatus]